MAVTRSRNVNRQTSGSPSTQIVNFTTPQRTKKSRSQWNVVTNLVKRGRRGPKMPKSARRNLLMTHPWVAPGSVNPHSVGCAGCLKEIKMDSRGEYYVGFWLKHTRRCKDILVSEFEDRGYTRDHALSILSQQKKARLQAARNNSHGGSPQSDSDSFEFDFSDSEDSNDSDLFDTSSSEASDASPVSLPASLPHGSGRKDLHLNPMEEVGGRATSLLDVLAEAAFRQMQEDFAVTNFGADQSLSN